MASDTTSSASSVVVSSAWDCALARELAPSREANATKLQRRELGAFMGVYASVVNAEANDNNYY